MNSDCVSFKFCILFYFRSCTLCCTAPGSVVIRGFSFVKFILELVKVIGELGLTCQIIYSENIYSKS